MNDERKISDLFQSAGFGAEAGDGNGDGFEVANLVSLGGPALIISVLTLGRKKVEPGFLFANHRGEWALVGNPEIDGERFDREINDKADRFSLPRIIAETVIREIGPSPSRDDVRRGVESLCSLIARHSFALIMGPPATETPAAERGRAANSNPRTTKKASSKRAKVVKIRPAKKAPAKGRKK